MKVIRIHPEDNVAVALEPLSAGAMVEVSGQVIVAAEDIGIGHKIALEEIPAGENVRKYGNTIGIASTDIARGSFVHTHNCHTGLSEASDFVYSHKVYPLPEMEARNFMGYRRANGCAAVRNELWILPLVGCVNGIAKQLAAENQYLVCGSIDGLYDFPHPYGCSQLGDDLAYTKKLLASLAKHPNAGGVLCLSLGCENLTLSMFQEALGEYDKGRIRFLVCQDYEDELAEGSRILQELAEQAKKAQRMPIPARELVIGMKCGGSDGLSGITANPAVGNFSDRLVSLGGTTILTEVPEMFGAENILFSRCENRIIFEKAKEMISDFKDYFIRHGQAVYENPSPGNKAGGITTLEDKSCGCVQKGGRAQIMDVLEYASPLRTRGLNLLYGPGNDLVSATNLAAAGAHLILFTTGRGTPFGAPVPTIKISSNSALAQKKSSWIDFDAGVIAQGHSIEETGEKLLDFVLEAAGGAQTKSEQHGIHELAIFKDGVTL